MAINIKFANHDENLFISGDLNEDAHSSLQTAGSKLRVKCVMNLKEIRMMNSSGILAWLSFMKLTHEVVELVFEECSAIFVDQVNMIPDLRRHATIKSVYRHYRCENCNSDGELLLVRGKDFNENGSLGTETKCTKCKSTKLAFADDDDDFFNFAKTRK